MDFKRAHPKIEPLAEHIPAGNCNLRFIVSTLKASKNSEWGK